MSNFSAPCSSSDRDEFSELHRQGAKAAARGDARDLNPLFESVNQPDATGESSSLWSARRDAWDLGFTSQLRPLGERAVVEPAVSVTSRWLDDALFGVTRVLTFVGNQALTGASGFLFLRDERLYLITSRHVLIDETSGHMPDRIEIELHTDRQDLTQRVLLSILLYREGVARWRQALDSAGEVDVAAIEIDRGALPPGCVLQPFGPQHMVEGYDRFKVGDRLAIPCFPLGFFDTVHHLPVVRQASIASFYGIRFQGQGFFLTDARMHRGSSGSPVLARLDADRYGHHRWGLLGVHSSGMDMSTRDLTQDESLGLNCAWYADVLLTLTGAGC